MIYRINSNSTTSWMVLKQTFIKKIKQLFFYFLALHVIKFVIDISSATSTVFNYKMKPLSWHWW